MTWIETPRSGYHWRFDITNVDDDSRSEELEDLRSLNGPLFLYTKLYEHNGWYNIIGIVSYGTEMMEDDVKEELKTGSVALVDDVDREIEKINDAIKRFEG